MLRNIPFTCFILFFSSLTTAEVNLSGFGTLALGIADGDSAGSFGSADGYSDSFSLAPNTFIGGQLFADIYGNLDAVVQATVDAERGWDDADNIDADLTWAFLSYRFNDHWQLQAGRQRMPHYAYSDQLLISYAYHWINAPGQLYNAPFNSFNGVSLLNSFDAGAVYLSSQLVYGEEPDSENDIGKQYSQIWGGRLSASYQWLTATVAYFAFDEQFEVNRPAGPGPGPGPGPANQTQVIEGTLKSWDFALKAEAGDWLILAEITSVDLRDLGDRYGIRQPVMLSVAKNIGAFTPHVSLGYNRELDFGNDDSVSPFAIIGSRWDFSNKAALKAEISTEEDEEGRTRHAFEAALVFAIF
ncbi:hypothetical protein [Reinekea marinisedimentorum]|uniref:OmpL-like beta-barrel porin-2 n=1 Tax=Reinekea marinisedimentorum TaxID=230495 RepID=A0A4R3HZM6_9GAMM|nr:hypothetical protein [Reinekea marinisedimentorum]TCS38846.1 hypothetical protein BCF53_11411 [Reinekea marinisedimentorum]